VLQAASGLTKVHEKVPLHGVWCGFPIWAWSIGLHGNVHHTVPPGRRRMNLTFSTVWSGRALVKGC